MGLSAGLGAWREEQAVTRSPGAASPDRFSEGTASVAAKDTDCNLLLGSSHSLCEPGLLPSLSVPQFPYPCLWPVMVLTSLGSYEHLMNSHM